MLSSTRGHAKRGEQLRRILSLRCRIETRRSGSALVRRRPIRVPNLGRCAQEPDYERPALDDTSRGSKRHRRLRTLAGRADLGAAGADRLWKATSMSHQGPWYALSVKCRERSRVKARGFRCAIRHVHLSADGPAPPWAPSYVLKRREARSPRPPMETKP
jgi:hypothetical protein